MSGTATSDVTPGTATAVRSRPTEDQRSRRYDLFAPVEGWLEAGLWLVLCYLVAGPLTGPAVVAVTRWDPGLAPASVRTTVAVFLWLLTGAVVLTHLARQLSGNPRTFDSADERLAWVENRRPTLASQLFYATATLAGILVLATLWPSIGSLLDAVFASVLVREGAAPVSPTEVGLLGCVLVGFAVAARSLDRLVHGLLYEFLGRSLRTVDGLARLDPASLAAREADRVVGWFAIGAAVALVGYWAVALGTSSAAVELPPGALSTTLLGAVVTAAFLLVAGTALVIDRPYGDRAFLVAAGLLTYAAVDTATLLAEQGESVGVAVFVALAALSLAVVTLVLTRGRRSQAGETLEDVDWQ